MLANTVDEELLKFVKTRVPSVRTQLKCCLKAAASRKPPLDTLAVRLSYCRIYMRFIEDSESDLFPRIVYRIGDANFFDKDLGNSYTVKGLAENFGVEPIDDIATLIGSVESGIGTEDSWIFAPLPLTVDLYNGSIVSHLLPDMPLEEKEQLWANEFASFYLNNVIDLEISRSWEAGEGYPFEAVEQILEIADLVLPKHPLTLFNWGRYREESLEWDLAIQNYQACMGAGLFPVEVLNSRIARNRATGDQWIAEGKGKEPKTGLF